MLRKETGKRLAAAFDPDWFKLENEQSHQKIGPKDLKGIDAKNFASFVKILREQKEWEEKKKNNLPSIGSCLLS
jgi:hypothetical protein